MALKLSHPGSILVAGPSFSGKTTWTKRLIETSMIEPFPKRIIWCYGEYQNSYDQLRPYNVEFVEGFPEDLYQSIDPTIPNLIIFDDLMSELQDSQVLANFFTKGCHHKNCTVIFILQNLFPQGKQCRTISLNTQYITLFKNSRDKTQANCLAKQMFPGKVKFFQEVYQDATKERGGYLLIDLRPDCPEDWRLRTKIFPGEDQVVYISK